MRPASSAFAAAIGRSHKLAVTVEVLAGWPATVIPCESGAVTLDSRAQIRGTSDLLIPTSGTLIPTSPSSLLAPYGNEIRVSRGVVYPDGTQELVAVGVHRIQDVDVVDTGSDLQLRITCQDRASRVIDARFEEPTVIAAGTNVATAIQALLDAAIPSLSYSKFTTTTETTPQISALEGDDRWALAQQLATSIGMSLYFDGDGDPVLAPAVTGSPVATVAEGDNGVLIAASKRWTRTGTYNRVIATGETSDAPPVRGVATDDDPDSATYYYGPFGRVPRFYSSPFISTAAQAEAAASAILRRELGTTQQVSFGALVDPRLEPGDTVRVTRQRTGIDENHVLDQVVIPLTADSVLTAETRQVQT